MIKWIREYGTVPGIANLHERFGFNSSWFSSVAFFAYPSANNYFTVLNSMLSVWFIFYLWSYIDEIFKQKSNATPFKSFACICILLVCALSWPVIRGNVSMANYDAITMVVVFVLFFETINEKFLPQKFKLEIEWLLWPVYLFTVRNINYPLLLLSVSIFILVLTQKRWKNTVSYLLLCALLIIPFLVRNVVLSGYPFFPSPFLNVFAVDWKVDSKVVDDLLYYIKYYNRVNPMFQSLGKTAELGSFHWIPYWFKYLFTYDKMLVIPGIAGYIAFCISGKKLFFGNGFISIFIIALLFQLASWFFIAPDPRFAYGCLLCGMVLLLIPFTYFLSKKIFKHISYFLLWSICLFMLSIGIKHFILNDRYNNNLIFPNKLPQPPITKVNINSIEVNIPSPILNNWNARCFATDLPCLYKIDDRLHLRGNQIEEGFSIKKK